MALFPTSVPAPRAQPRAEQSAHDAAPWVEALARLGYAAKGVVYVLVGAISLHAAASPLNQERPEDSKGALLAILDQPLGWVLLGLMALGISGYVVWKLVQAVLDPERKGTGARALVQRAGYLLSAVLYGALAVEAVRLIMGSAERSSGDGRTDHWTALVMEQPLGRWAVGIVGAGIILFGLYELYKGARSNLRKRLDLSDLADAARPLVLRFGRLGLAARGVVFLIIGWLLIRAAREYEPTVATDLGGALRVLQSQSHGPVLLGLVAGGLMAYGFFQMVKARYRVIHAG